MPKPRPQNRKATPARSGAQPRAAAPWFEITNLAEPGFAEIKLRGYIGEAKTYRDYWTGEEVENKEGAGTLAEFEAEIDALGAVENLQLSIFSQGGDWATGVAIHNLLVRHPANKIAIIDGLCASAATYPAMACGEIRIPSNASMLIHEASNMAFGTAADLRAAADNLESISNNIAELYAARTGKGVDEIRNLMSEDRYLSGQECIDLGLADTLIEPLANMAQRAGSLQPTNEAALQNAPAEILALFDMRALTTATRNSTSMKIRTPLLTSATDPAAPAGGAAGGSPAATPAAAPTNVAPPVAAPVIEAPTNAAPPVAAPDIAAMIQAAVTNAVAPLQAEVTRLSGLNAAGITPQNLAGAAPAAGVAPADAPPQIDIKNMSAAQLINLGRKNITNSKPPIVAL